MLKADKLGYLFAFKCCFCCHYFSCALTLTHVHAHTHTYIHTHVVIYLLLINANIEMFQILHQDYRCSKIRHGIQWKDLWITASLVKLTFFKLYQNDAL